MELKYTSKISDIKKVRINITTAYKWGRGWTEEEARDFKNDVYKSLIIKGYEIKKGDSYGACETINKPDGTYLYLHPMEFTGYCSLKDFEIIKEILENSETVESVDYCSIEDVEDIRDYEYKKILIDNSKEILEWIKNNPEKDGFDFAKESRINRVGDSCGLCSSDIDIDFIETFKRVYKTINA